jgi:hypothetical protein
MKDYRGGLAVVDFRKFKHIVIRLESEKVCIKSTTFSGMSCWVESQQENVMNIENKRELKRF